MTCEIIVDSCCDMTPQLRKRLDVTFAGEVLIAVKIRDCSWRECPNPILSKQSIILLKYENLFCSGAVCRKTGG